MNQSAQVDSRQNETGLIGQELPGENGLFCCRNDHLSPPGDLGGREQSKVVPLPVRSEDKDWMEDERAFREMEHRRRSAQLRVEGMQEKTYCGWTFAAAQDSTVIQRAQRYVDAWQTVRKENLGILFWGPVGTGKTFASACIANALLDQRVPVLMTNFPKLLNTLTGKRPEERSAFLDGLNRYDLLIIDDLGVERSTEYALEQIYSVVDGRYQSGKPMIVTTNLALGEMKSASDLAHDRIYSRVLEMCTPIRVDGPDRRRSMGSSKQELMRNLLCGDA